jgi:hypothetical protein
MEEQEGKGISMLPCKTATQKRPKRCNVCFNQPESNPTPYPCTTSCTITSKTVVGIIHYTLPSQNQINEKWCYIWNMKRKLLTYFRNFD